jgi:hypothetical protein
MSRRSSSPVIRLRRLSDNELLALVRRLTKLYAQREGLAEVPLKDEQIEEFLLKALSKAGAEELITPREIIRDYLTLLNILRDNKGAKFEELVNRIEITAELMERERDDSALPAPKEKISIFDIDI